MVEEARKLFVEMPERNSVSWTAMINGYVRIGNLEEARRLLDEMPFESVGAKTAMMAGYVESMRINEARWIFESVSEPDVMCWNTVISGYGQCGDMDEALRLFKRMPEKDVVSWNTMVAGYAQQGQIDRALEFFEQMSVRDTVSWNSVVSGFAQNGFYTEALQHLVLMMREGRRPDWCTFGCCLSACAHLAALQVGKQIHGLIMRSCYADDLFAGNALVTMYARCGRISRGKQVFDEMAHPDLISWNSLIAGYALNGYGMEVISLFQEMENVRISPDEVTFVGVLSACSHAGMIDEGLKMFDSMRRDYWIEPVAEHYACVVDLLGRAGRLEAAYELVNQMPIKANAGIWGALLGACRIHRNPELANIAAEKLMEFEPHKTSNYVMLSNIYADAGRWEEVEKLRILMKDTGLQKQLGCSWIEVGNKIFAFSLDNLVHPRTAEICLLLETSVEHMRNTQVGLALC